MDAIPVLGRWVRGALVGIAVGLLAVFSVAAWLNPYDQEGQARRLETHTQLHLPPCTFKTMTGMPCPGCGLTTSFSLLIHGDIWNSLKANAVGTLLAICWMAMIPWSLVCAIRGRTFIVWSLEAALTRAIVFFLVLLLARWAIVLALAWSNGTTPGVWRFRAPAPADSWRREDGDTFATRAAGTVDSGRHPLHGLQRPAVAFLFSYGRGSQAPP